MAKRINLKHLPYDRTKIQVTQLLNRLTNHAMGKLDLSPTQVKAIEIMLRKALPDLSAVEHSGDMQETVHYYAEVPKPAATTEEWTAGNPIKAKDTQH
jgi:hypothetical protein